MQLVVTAVLVTASTASTSRLPASSSLQQLGSSGRVDLHQLHTTRLHPSAQSLTRGMRPLLVILVLLLALVLVEQMQPLLPPRFLHQLSLSSNRGRNVHTRHRLPLQLMVAVMVATLVVVAAAATAAQTQPRFWHSCCTS